jgi:O-palmitoleoyl-L-serine hydrolase
MARLASLVALAASAPAALAAMDPGDGFNLTLFPPSSPAVCLDGTPAGIYYRPGVGAGASTWIIEMEGGGWCVSLDDCVSRSKTALGSSSSWPATGSPTMDGGSHGLFSNSCADNPHFCNSSMVHVNYCDGASFAGSVAAPVNVNGTNLFFAGRAILDAALAHALALGMADATAVIFKGCSAGGLATILHLDYVAATLRAAIPGVAVVGLPDAGYFLNHTSTTGSPTYTPLYQTVATMQNVTYSVDESCVAAHGGPTSPTAWACFMAQYTAPYLTTPAFFAQGERAPVRPPRPPAHRPHGSPPSPTGPSPVLPPRSLLLSLSLSPFHPKTNAGKFRPR